MKKYTLLVLSLALTTPLFAQKDAKAKAILAAVSKKYSSFNVIRSEFNYSISSTQSGSTETMTGVLTLQAKTNKYKLVFDEQEIGSDGINQWTYLKEDKEVQLSKVDNSANAINPAKIYTIYQKGYKYIYTGEAKKNGAIYQHIDLTPTDKKSTIFKIKLSIDKATKLIQQAVIFNKNGTKFTYTVNAFTSTIKLSESYFEFNKADFPGAEIVDLR